MKAKSVPASLLFLPSWVLLGPDMANAGHLQPPPPPPPNDHDHENCPPPPPPGPPKPNNDGTYEEGISRGVHEASKIWHDTGCDCVNVWGYEDQVEDMLETKFAESSADTDKQKDYKRGVQDGADLVVVEHERKCVDESPAECVELGEAAAQMLAFSYCPFSAADEASGYSTPNYMQSCRDVAYSVCKGEMREMLESNGCSDVPPGDLSSLQEECTEQVDSMTPGMMKTAVAKRGLKGATK